jgi:alpha-L-rhamnosidase
MLGTQFSLDVLTDAGFVDLAYGLMLRTEFPSWGYMVVQGATTIWESWSDAQDDGERIHKLSQNHYAFGAICGFLFRRVAGIDAITPGFETIAIRPVLDARLKRGGGDYDSVMGRISTDWAQNADGSFSLKVHVPANASARVHLPASMDARIQEGRLDIVGRRDLRVIERSAREAIIETGSGTYAFVVDDRPNGSPA